jgi:hypothetical protein
LLTPGSGIRDKHPGSATLIISFSCVFKYPVLESPFTVDVLVELDRRFKEIVTDKLDAKSKEALITQRDPSTMSKAEASKIRKSIRDLVYGNNNLTASYVGTVYRYIITLDLKEIGTYGRQKIGCQVRYPVCFLIGSSI